MSFHPGHLVVCVDDEPHGLTSNPKISGAGSMDGLTKGRVYTVRGIINRWYGPALYLCEIERPPQLDGSESAYAASRFRPVDEARLSVFRKALLPLSHKEREKA